MYYIQMYIAHTFTAIYIFSLMSLDRVDGVTNQAGQHRCWSCPRAQRYWSVNFDVEKELLYTVAQRMCIHLGSKIVPKIGHAHRVLRSLLLRTKNRKRSCGTWTKRFGSDFHSPKRAIRGTMSCLDVHWNTFPTTCMPLHMRVVK